MTPSNFVARSVKESVAPAAFSVVVLERQFHLPSTIFKLSRERNRDVIFGRSTEQA